MLSTYQLLPKRYLEVWNYPPDHFLRSWLCAWLPWKFWSSEKSGLGDQNLWNNYPGGSIFPENFGPPMKKMVRLSVPAHGPLAVDIVL